VNDFATHQGGERPNPGAPATGPLLDALEGVGARVRELEAALADAGSAAQRDAARRSDLERELSRRISGEADARAQLDEARREADRLRSRLESIEARGRQAVEAERVEREQLRVQAEGLRAEVARLRSALEDERAGHQAQAEAMAGIRAHVAEGRQQWSRIEALLDELSQAETAAPAAGAPNRSVAETQEPPAPAAPAPGPASRPTRTSHRVEPSGEATRVASPAAAPAPAAPPPADASAPPPAAPAPPEAASGGIGDLARSDLGRAERVTAQGALERLPSRLEPGEQPKRLAIAEYAGAVALMAVTERRILLLRLDEQEYQAIPYERVTSVDVTEERFGRSSLRLASDAGDVVVSRRRRDAVEELSRLLRERASVG
jgi:hypothetical protein